MALGEGEAKSRFDLQDVLFDSTLREAFHCHLSGCLMAEVLDLWLALNRFFEISEERERIQYFVAICREFFLPSSTNLVNHSFDVLSQLRSVYEDLTTGKITVLPPNACEPVRVATLDLLAYTCLPLFIVSDTFRDFQEGVVDSSRSGFSRQKAEQFFGVRIEGQLRRAEIAPLNTGGIRRNGFLHSLFGIKRKQRTPISQSANPTRTEISSSDSTGTSQLDLTGAALSDEDENAVGIYGLL